MPKSLPYHDFLISRLKDPIYAASYLETHFELEDGDDPDPELIQLALCHVAEALGEAQMTPEQAKLHREKLEELLSQRGSEAIYNLGQWLNALGLKLTVTVCESASESASKSATEIASSSEVPVQ